MARVYKSVCIEIDLLLLRISKLIEKEITYKVAIEKLMNRGFINIAKARYIMGSTCVTKMQLPSKNSYPIQPIATVCRAELNNYWVFHVHRKDIPKGMDKKNTENLKEFISEENENLGEDYDSSDFHSNHSESDFKNMIQNDPKALKKSKIAFHVHDNHYRELNDELLDEYSNHSGSNESLCSLSDPMRLFGVLVPNTLKLAQDIFIEAVNLVGKCATLQSELKEALCKYNHLKNVKMLMETAAEEAKINIMTPKVYWTLSEGSTILSHSTSREEEQEPEEVSVTKSVRSVFYDFQTAKSQENEMSIWTLESNYSKSKESQDKN